MTYGKYRPGATLAYRLDPRTKMVFALVLIIATFATSNWTGVAVLAASALAALVASGVRPLEVLAMLRPFVWLMAFVLVFNSLFASAGLAYGLGSVLRFVIVLIGTSFLMVTTSPTELTDGVALMLRPLARLGIPIDNVDLAVGMTLRFVPVVLAEFDRVKAAQEARFACFEAKRLSDRVRAYIPVMVPLFASIMRRSRRLALALGNRGYGRASSGGRTCIRSYRLGRVDAAVLAGSAGLLLAAILF